MVMEVGDEEPQLMYTGHLVSLVETSKQSHVLTVTSAALLYAT